MDAHIGTVLDELDKPGGINWDNTIVIFTVDHGEMAGGHGLRQKGPLVYRENINVPFIVCHPDIDASGSTDDLTSYVDLTPTLLAFAGVDDELRKERHPQLKGRNFADVLNRDNPSRVTIERGNGEDGVLFTFDALSTNDYDWIKAMTQLGYVHQSLLESLDDIDNPSALAYDLTKRGFIRVVIDGRYKFDRYY